MLAKKTTRSVVVVLVIVGMLLVGQSVVSQPRQRGQRGQRGQAQGGFGGDGFNPAQMRKAMEQGMQRILGATDTRWKVIGPRVMKVMELNRQVGGSGGAVMMGGIGGGSGGPGGPTGVVMGGMNQKLTEVEKAQKALQTMVANTAATPDAIKKKLTTLRAVKEKAKQKLAKAQHDLLKVVTLREEATLVVMGMLD